jgi:hypothetical protein
LKDFLDTVRCEEAKSLSIAEKLRCHFGSLGYMFYRAIVAVKQTTTTLKFYVNPYWEPFFEKWNCMLKGLSLVGRYVSTTSHLTSVVRAAEGDRCDYRELPETQKLIESMDDSTGN